MIAFPTFVIATSVTLQQGWYLPNLLPEKSNKNIRDFIRFPRALDSIGNPARSKDEFLAPLFRPWKICIFGCVIL